MVMGYEQSTDSEHTGKTVKMHLKPQTGRQRHPMKEECNTVQDLDLQKTTLGEKTRPDSCG